MGTTIDDFITNYLGQSFFSYFVIAFIILVVAFFISTMIRKSINTYLNKSSEKLHIDSTKYKFLKNAAGLLIYLIALILIMYTIPELRSLGYTLFAGAGIAATILAFASQQAFSNIIGGIFIVIFKPFRVGDNVKISDQYWGIVEDITLRHTVIRNFEHRRIIIPNSVISSETILNSTIEDPKICNFIEIGIGYKSSIDKAISIIQEEALKHANLLDNRSDEQKEKGEPIVRCRVIELGKYAVNIRAYCWAADTGKAWELRCDLLKSVKERFDLEGVEIPFPQRVIHMVKND